MSWSRNKSAAVQLKPGKAQRGGKRTVSLSPKGGQRRDEDDIKVQISKHSEFGIRCLVLDISAFQQ
jgi:hypothetical protein